MRKNGRLELAQPNFYKSLQTWQFTNLIKCEKILIHFLKVWAWQFWAFELVCQNVSKHFRPQTVWKWLNWICYFFIFLLGLSRFAENALVTPHHSHTFKQFFFLFYCQYLLISQKNCAIPLSQFYWVTGKLTIAFSLAKLLLHCILNILIPFLTIYWLFSEVCNVIKKTFATI